MPAKVSVKIRPMVTAGFANEVELVNQYAAPMYAPTAGAASAPRPVRARAKISRTSPAVATTSPSRCPPVTRCVVEIAGGMSNMAFGQHGAADRRRRSARRRTAATSPEAGRCGRDGRGPSPRAETTGLKCAPETGPSIRISTVSPSAVARLFSSSCSPTSSGESRCAAIPEPTTTVTSRPVPSELGEQAAAGCDAAGSGGAVVFMSDHLDGHELAQSRLRQ